MISFQMIRSVYTGEILSTTDQLRGTGVSNALVRLYFRMGYCREWIEFKTIISRTCFQFQMVGLAAIYLLKNQLPNLFRNQTLIEESRETTVDYIENIRIPFDFFRFMILVHGKKM